MKNKWIEWLKENGLKATPGRVLVLDALEDLGKPVGVQELVDWIENQNERLDQATVYRTLQLLLKKKVIEVIDFRDGKYRYELQNKHHHHLVCEGCGVIEEIGGDELLIDEIKLGKSRDFLIKSHSLEFFGLCGKCK